MARRRLGIAPKMNMAKPWQARTNIMLESVIHSHEPCIGNPSQPNSHDCMNSAMTHHTNVCGSNIPARVRTIEPSPMASMRRLRPYLTQLPNASTVISITMSCSEAGMKLLHRYIG